MSQSRAAYRVDANQPAIVRALRDIGASVQHLHMVGHGCPDILVGYNGVNYLMEIKSSEKATFTEDEYQWRAEWYGNVFIVTSPEQAIEIVRTNPQELQY
jgi:hypothetical protein